MLSIIEGAVRGSGASASGVPPPLASFRPMQRVWVQLSADGSRAHGPTLRMHLLADGHPAALEAAAAEARASTSGGGGGGSSSTIAKMQQGPVGGCGSLPRASLLPGTLLPAPGRPALRPPPGFEQGGAAAAASAAAAAAARGKAEGPAAAAAPEAAGAAPAVVTPSRLPLVSLAAQLQRFLSDGGGGNTCGGTSGGLAWQVAVPPLDAMLPSSSSSSNDPVASRSSATTTTTTATAQLVHRALRCLRARAARLQLRADCSGKPCRPSARRSAAAAAEVRHQIEDLQRLMPAG